MRINIAIEHVYLLEVLGAGLKLVNLSSSITCMMGCTEIEIHVMYHNIICNI